VDTQVLTTIIGVAATILALSVVVQVIQEMYKYFTSSQSRVYVKVLTDHMGAIAKDIAFAPDFADLRTRGPFEILRRRPTGRLMPLEADELRAAAERTAPLWVQRTLDQLRLEEASGAGSKIPSVAWTSFLEKLSSVARGAKGYETAKEIAAFLAEHGHSWESGKDHVGTVSHISDPKHTFDPTVLIKAFEREFVPHIVKTAENTRLLDDHLAYATGRRNLRHTVVIGFLLAAAVGLPVQAIYQNAATMPPDKVIEFAEAVTDLYEKTQQASPAGGEVDEETARPTVDENPDLTQITPPERLNADSLLKPLIRYISDARMSGTPGYEMMSIIGSKEWKAKYHGFWGILLYVLGNIGTAILVGFGAPFWNDILKSVLGLKRTLRGDVTGSKN